MSAPKVEVGYWDCRGLVNPVILMLEYLQKPYILQTPSKDLLGPPPTFDKSRWYEAKSSLLKGFDFPNLPYYHDKELGIRLTQSSAILMHLARCHGLLVPANHENDINMLADIDLLREEIKDLVAVTTTYCYDGKNTKYTTENYVRNVADRIQLLGNKLTKNSSKWFLGDALTYIDFMAYDILDQQRILLPKILDDFPDIQAFLKRFESLHTLKSYFESDRYRKFPLWSERSFIGRSETNLIKEN